MKYLALAKTCGSVAMLFGTALALIATPAPKCANVAPTQRFRVEPGCGPGGEILVSERYEETKERSVLAIDDAKALNLSAAQYGLVYGCPRSFRDPGWHFDAVLREPWSMGSADAAVYVNDSSAAVAEGKQTDYVVCRSTSDAADGSALILTCIVSRSLDRQCSSRLIPID